ncbi:hypothetical protein [Arthrobacter sp. ZGTC412]|uniref:hypothetical protein n=1 Tax=Arthrobacter sp. ZGTC412 TaxID=2058900 RepID=UPI000CE537C5|nr:hypothetical protein [Arthrobacter sp. ZGTC412]
MRLIEAVLAVSVALTPVRLREDREEQWRADLRDGPAVGISVQSLLFGALCSSATARTYELLHRGGMVLSRITKGENMKLILGIAGAAAILVGGAAIGIHAGYSSETPVARTPVADRPIGGYEGWWNSTPVSSSADGLPQETVTVNTRTGKIVDAFNRAKNSTLISDVDYDLVPDPAWPADSIVIIDTASGAVIEDFLIDERGVPLDESGRPLDAAAG